MSIEIKPQNKGKLHRALGIPEATKIPPGKIATAKRSGNPALVKEATFAANAAKWHKPKSVWDRM